MRYLGIDYGKKRVGVALSDEGGAFAFPYAIIENTGVEVVAKKVLELCKKEAGEHIVVGSSVTTSGIENPVMIDIRAFVEALLKYSDIPVDLEPEWFTTQEARRYQGRERDVDDSAAALILQRYLDAQKGRG